MDIANIYSKDIDIYVILDIADRFITDIYRNYVYSRSIATTYIPGI